MIGRGTRFRPDLYGPARDKTDFLVFDFCANLEYFSQDLPGAEGSLQKPLTQRLFEERLRLVLSLDESACEPELRTTAAAWLHELVSGMNLENVVVRPHRRAVERFGDAGAWAKLTEQHAAEAMALAGLPSALRDPDEDAKRFDLLVLRRQLAQLEGDAVTAEAAREPVQSIAAATPSTPTSRTTWTPSGRSPSRAPHRGPI